MPIIDMPVATLLTLVNRGGPTPPVGEQDLAQRLPAIGCEIEEFAQTRQFACAVCGRIYDRTEAQGPPLHCANCGADFRERPAALGDLGVNRVARLNLLAVRPDIFDPGGMARFVRGHMGIRPGLIEYAVAPPRLSVRVDPALSNERSFRPQIACAVIRGVRLDNDLIKILMNLQEDLHWALGRNRKLASIGVYDLGVLKGTRFRYDAVAPDALRFVPLGFAPDRPDSALTPREILERHKTGQAFAHLLRGFDAYPLLRDEAGTVLSLPPIINSEATRVTLRSTDLFCDVTGLAQRTIDRALNILVTGLKEVMPACEIEAVTIELPDGRRTTPDLAPAEMVLSARQVSDTIGVALDGPTVGTLLERMGHGVDVQPARDADARLDVRVPAWRNDVMHPVDLIEDAAVAYGYDRLVPQLVPTFTIGGPRAIEELSVVARRVMTGLGFHQVMTLTLSSEPAAFDKWLLSGADPLRAAAVKIENPISVEQTLARPWLLPGLLETLAINRRFDLPQHLFEVGDVCLVDAAAETGAREERHLAAVMIGTHVGYADIRAVCDALAHELTAPLAIAPAPHASLIPGRSAEIRGQDGAAIGLMGELHPAVLENYGLKHAVAVVELDLGRLLS